MALINADRVRETTTTEGTGTYDLGGAVSGFRTFVAGIGTGNACHYVVEDGTNWEVGVGTVTDATPDTLSRDRIIASSNSGNAVSWGAGTKSVFCSGVVENNIRTSVLSSDFASITVTTNTDVTGLAFSVKNGIRYWFEFGVLYRVASTGTGIRMSVTVPNVTKFGAVVNAPVSTAADGTANIFRGHVTSSGDQVVGTGSPAATTDHFAEIRGIVVPSADGTLQLVCASEVDANGVTIAQGSYGLLKVLG